MQYQVPQFIETEDKIVGPLSLRQFIYVGVGVGLSGMLFFVLQTWLWVILSAILVGGAIAISFIKIGGRPLANVLLSAFYFYWNPQTYVWQPEHPVITPAHEEKHEENKPPKTPGFSIEKFLATKPKKPAAVPDAAKARASVAAGTTLHKSWENIQTGKTMSDKEFIDKKMSGRYEIFRKIAGDRDAARRVDYR